MAELVRFSESPEGRNIRAKAFGLGSAGCNMVSKAPFTRVAVSTSGADLERSGAERTLLIGQERLVGVYHSDESVIKQLPSVAGHEILDVFNNTDVAFLMCGLGGVSGSLGSRVFSTVARSRGVLDIVLAATPFSAESARRRDFASRIFGELLGSSTLCIGFGNDDLSTLAPHMPMSRAFALMNSIMLRPLIDLHAVMSRSDVSLLRENLSGAPHGRFGLGVGRGDDRIEKAVHEALSSPWFDFEMTGARTAIVVYSSSDPWDKEIEKSLELLASQLPSSRFIYGSYRDPSLGDRVRLSVILCSGGP